MFAVIFDLDGVLIDSYRAHYQSWLEMARSEGLVFTEADFAATFGRTSRETIASCWGEKRFDAAKIKQLDDFKEAAFRRIVAADFPTMPGALDLLRALRDAGFRLAVGSSAPPDNVHQAVDLLGCRELFQAIVTGADVVRGKPDPQVFLVAAERLGAAPRRCAVVEDAPAGVAAANAAGMTCIGLMSTGRTPADVAAAALAVASLDELSPQRIRKLIESRSS